MVKSSTGVSWLISINIAKAQDLRAFVELNDDMKSTCHVAYQANTMYEDTILLGSSGVKRYSTCRALIALQAQS